MSVSRSDVIELARCVVEAWEREKECPLCGTITPVCHCVLIASRIAVGDVYADMLAGSTR